MPDTTSTISTGKPDATEIGHVRFGKGSPEKDPNHGHLADGLLRGTAGSASGPGKRTRSNPGTAPGADSTARGRCG